MATVKIRSKGQITIPSYIREELDLKEDSALFIFNIDGIIIITPKKPLIDEFSSKVSKEMGKKDLTLDQLLVDLKKQRKVYNRQTYGL